VSATLPRVLAGIEPHGALTLDAHVVTHGPLKLAGHGRRRRTAPLIDEAERAGLLGHGGASFSTARKMRSVVAARGRPLVLVNGVEAEPASEKDRVLFECLPHLVLDGAVAAADAIGADEVIVATRESLGDAADAVEGAIEERRDRGVRISLATVPDAYLAGQETALCSYLSGGALRPTFTPPRPGERGVDRRPTLVNNAETMAHLALIARHGAGWFRELGTDGQPGSTLVTLAGAVRRPGVYEIEFGSSLAHLIDVAGGSDGPLQAALIGGYAGSWLTPAELSSVALDDESLRPLGATMLAGVVFLLSGSACVVRETAALAGWMASQSARQCGPCLHGLDALAGELAALAEGYGGQAPEQRIRRVASLTARRGACAHPDGAVKALLSALDAFPELFADHARAGACTACDAPAELPLPGWRLPDARRRVAA